MPSKKSKKSAINEGSSLKQNSEDLLKYADLIQALDWCLFKGAYVEDYLHAKFKKIVETSFTAVQL